MRNPYFQLNKEICTSVQFSNLTKRAWLRDRRLAVCIVSFVSFLSKKQLFSWHKTKTMLLWLSSNELWIKCTPSSSWYKCPNIVFHARITPTKHHLPDHNTSHLWLMLQLFRPRLGIWNDLQRGTFFTHIKTRSCSPEPKKYNYKHHLKFLRPDELNSKNKWLVKSGTEPFAHSSSNGLFICCEDSLLFFSICFLVNLNTTSVWGGKSFWKWFCHVRVQTPEKTLHYTFFFCSCLKCTGRRMYKITVNHFGNNLGKKLVNA